MPTAFDGCSACIKLNKVRFAGIVTILEASAPELLKLFFKEINPPLQKSNAGLKGQVTIV